MGIATIIWSKNIIEGGYNLELVKVWEKKLFSLLDTLKEYEDIDRSQFDKHMNEVWLDKVKLYKRLVQEHEELVNYLREVEK